MNYILEETNIMLNEEIGKSSILTYKPIPTLVVDIVRIAKALKESFTQTPRIIC